MCICTNFLCLLLYSTGCNCQKFTSAHQQWLGMNKFVRTKSHRESKFSKISLELLCTWGIVVLYSHCGFYMQRQMAPQQCAEFRSACFQFCSTLRKDSVTNYGSIWTQFPPSVRGLDVLYNTLNVLQFHW